MGNKQSSPIQKLSKTLSEVRNSPIIQDISKKVVDTAHNK
jgi:hypothetical protein